MAEFAALGQRLGSIGKELESLESQHDVFSLDLSATLDAIHQGLGEEEEEEEEAGVSANINMLRPPHLRRPMHNLND
jgi:hypothetical protein